MTQVIVRSRFFVSLHQYMKFPLLTREIRPEHCDPLYLYRELRGVFAGPGPGPGAECGMYGALLESADRAHGINDHSFLALGARDSFVIENGEIKGSQFIADGPVSDPLEPFEGMIGDGAEGEFLRMGYLGFLSYEAVRYFEAINLPAKEGTPDAQFFLPEVLLHIDHAEHVVTLVTHEDTKIDLDAIEDVVLSSPYQDDDLNRVHRLDPSSVPMPTLEDIEPLRQMGSEEYFAAVESIQKGVLAGETFQVVLSQELILDIGSGSGSEKSESDPNPPARPKLRRSEGGSPDPLLVYEQLRAINPSPYMYFYQVPDRTIVGASPETLVRVDGRKITYRPIAGTRKRTGDEAKDQEMMEELRTDQKERCEHQMLVDLGRNDVGRVAEVSTVEVHDPFHIERYSHVFHIVSNIQAVLRSDLSSLDAVRSCFPQGTVSGAPKVRAMEMIRDHESSPRGIYAGGFGYIDLSGNLDFAIMIRTMLFQDGAIRIRSGGGIVKDSIAEMEEKECLHKARSCLAAVSLARSQYVSRL